MSNPSSEPSDEVPCWSASGYRQFRVMGAHEGMAEKPSAEWKTSGAKPRLSTSAPTGRRKSDAASSSLPCVNWASVAAIANRENQGKCGRESLRIAT